MKSGRRQSSSGALAVVLGRAGSKGLPGKNALLLAGEPVICHTIRDALEARCVDRVVVTSDGQSILSAAQSMGVGALCRPADLATDSATVQDVVRHAVEEVSDSHEVVVILYANVPIRPHDLIDRAFDRLVASGCDSVQSYTTVGKHHPYWMVTLDEDRRVQSYTPQPHGAIDRRQDLPKLLIPDGGVIAVRRECLMRCDLRSPHDFLGDDRRGIQTRPGEVVDVDAPIDLLLAEAILSRDEVVRA